MAGLITLLLAVLAGLLRSVQAHGGLANYTVGDTWYRGYDPDEPAADQDGKSWMVQRKWATIDPIFNVTSPYLACNAPGSPPPSSIPIAAGDNITAVYWYWLHPYGPMSVWLAHCPQDDCVTANVTNLDWFKIWEAGLINGTVVEGIWWQKAFQHWDGSPDLWSVRIPPTLRPGAYIIRHEILSIHITNKPQFYPECAHLNISGNGTAMPPTRFTKKFPGGYATDDPSIFIDLYSDEMRESTNYTIPGGPVWDGWVDKYCVGC